MIPSVLAHHVEQGIKDFLRTTFPVTTPYFSSFNAVSAGDKQGVLQVLSGSPELVNTLFEDEKATPFEFRRGYNELETSSNRDVLDYFDGLNTDAMAGHISNIKGIVFEQEVVAALNYQGMEALIFEAINHPVSDIAILSDGDIAAEI